MSEDCDCEYSQVDEIAENIYDSEFYDFFDSSVPEDIAKIKNFKARISAWIETNIGQLNILICLLYTSPSPRDLSTSRMPSSA